MRAPQDPPATPLLSIKKVTVDNIHISCLSRHLQKARNYVNGPSQKALQRVDTKAQLLNIQPNHLVCITVWIQSNIPIDKLIFFFKKWIFHLMQHILKLLLFVFLGKESQDIFIFNTPLNTKLAHQHTMVKVFSSDL